MIMIMIYNKKDFRKKNSLFSVLSSGLELFYSQKPAWTGHQSPVTHHPYIGGSLESTYDDSQDRCFSFAAFKFMFICI